MPCLACGGARDASPGASAPMGPAAGASAAPPSPASPVVAAAPAPSLSGAGPTAPADARCAVWDRENEFARSVAEHDARAFAEHVHPAAVFVGSGASPLRGRDAIVAGWADIVRGDKMVLTWHPTSVDTIGDSGVALSRGPYWIELTKPGANPKYLVGTFQSTWVKDADGAWRVAIDGNTPPPTPATEADVKKLAASVPAHCPRD
jgi:uncharacterized protein (TIGR02246 family)